MNYKEVSLLLLLLLLFLFFVVVTGSWPFKPLAKKVTTILAHVFNYLLVFLLGHVVTENLTYISLSHIYMSPFINYAMRAINPMYVLLLSLNINHWPKIKI